MMRKPSKLLPSKPANQSLLLLAALAAVTIFAGCSSVSTHVDKDPVVARTFSFMDPGVRQPPDSTEQSQQVHAMIQQALTRNLAAKGVTHVATGGDVTVAYLVIVGNNVATTSLNTYFGYTDDANALVEKVHTEQTESENRGYFEAGTLVIDFVDPKTSKLLQRRSIHAEVLHNLPMEQRAERAQGIVDEALKDLPISSTPR